MVNERVFEIEEKNPNLDSLEINGIKMWPFVRILIRYLLMQHPSKNHVETKKQNTRIASGLKAVFQALRELPLWARHKKIFLISNVLEKKTINGRLIDKLSQPLIDECGK